MSKPWDHLKKTDDEHSYPRIDVGEWTTTGKMQVVVQRFLPGYVEVAFETDCRPPWIAGAIDLRELAEFCTELADQLESQ